MVLDSYREVADRVLVPIAKRVDADPNVLTVVAFFFAILAGISFYLGSHWLLAGALFVFLNAFFDALDGKVAKVKKKETKRGDFLDHVLDRYADIIILGGIMLGPYCNPIIGLLGLLAVMMASYMGTQAQAMGVRRDYGGILGRADRLVILVVTPMIQYVLVYHNLIWIQIIGHWFTFFDFVMIYFLVAGTITAVQRAVKTWRHI